MSGVEKQPVQQDAASQQAAAGGSSSSDATETSLPARKLETPDGFFNSFKSLLFLAVAGPIVFLFVPRLIWILRDPKLPGTFVRPSYMPALERLGLQPQTPVQCQNLNAAAPDPWHRAAPHNKDWEVQSLAYCEDGKLIEELGVAIFACDPGRHKWNTVLGLLQDPAPRGALWMYEYASGNTAEPQLIDVKGYPDTMPFHPLGFHVQKQAGKYRLFLTNHGLEKNTIDILDLYPGDGAAAWSANYVRSITHSLATHAPNSVAMLDDNTLLVTQDHLFPSRAPALDQLTETYTHTFGATLGPSFAKAIHASPIISRTLSKVETLLGLPTSFVSAVDLNEPHMPARIVKRGFAFANGIAVSPKGQTIAVAATMDAMIKFFAPQRDAGGKLVGLKLVDKVHVPMVVDNLDFTEPLWEDAQEAGNSDLFDGAKLLAGGHPRPLQNLVFARDPSNMAKQSGTWAITVEPSTGVPSEKKGKMELSAWRAQQDGAPAPAATRCMTQNSRWLIKTLYQAQFGYDPARGFGVATGTVGLWDPKAKGTLLVPGLYSRGVLSCTLVGLT